MARNLIRTRSTFSLFGRTNKKLTKILSLFFNYAIIEEPKISGVREWESIKGVFKPGLDFICFLFNR